MLAFHDPIILNQLTWAEEHLCTIQEGCRFVSFFSSFTFIPTHTALLINWGVFLMKMCERNSYLLSGSVLVSVWLSVISFQWKKLSGWAEKYILSRFRESCVQLEGLRWSFQCGHLLRLVLLNISLASNLRPYHPPAKNSHESLTHFCITAKIRLLSFPRTSNGHQHVTNWIYSKVTDRFVWADAWWWGKCIMTANHSFASWDIWRFVLSLVSQLSLNISQLKITEEKIGESFFFPPDFEVKTISWTSLIKMTEIQMRHKSSDCWGKSWPATELLGY